MTTKEKRQGRTPNSECMICGKKLYRRPFELAKIRYVACMEHREIAKGMAEVTQKQLDALKLGRTKGENHLIGKPKSQSSKIKRSSSMKKWCASNPDKVSARGENHYNWKGGASRFNISIRQMDENRRWMDAVKARDNHKCTICGSSDKLESHHIVPLADILTSHNITNRQEARNCAKLWDISNGVTLCQKCHYELHGRKYDNN